MFFFVCHFLSFFFSRSFCIRRWFRFPSFPFFFKGRAVDTGEFFFSFTEFYRVCGRYVLHGVPFTAVSFTFAPDEGLSIANESYFFSYFFFEDLAWWPQRPPSFQKPPFWLPLLPPPHPLFVGFFTGLNQFLYWLYSVILDFYRFGLNCVYWVLLGSICSYLVLINHWLSQDLAFLFSFIGFYWVLLGFTGFYRFFLLGFIG